MCACMHDTDVCVTSLYKESICMPSVHVFVIYGYIMCNNTVSHTADKVPTAMSQLLQQTVSK